MKYLPFVLILLMALGSCADLEKENQLSRIDDLNARLDSIDGLYSESLIDTLAKFKHNTWAVENRIKQHYRADTIDMAFGRKMDAFKIMRKNVGPMSKSEVTLRTGMKEERQKLSELYEDIDSGNGQRDKYDEYIDFEENKVEQLESVLEEFIRLRTSILETYDSLYIELNAYSHSLVNKEE